MAIHKWADASPRAARDMPAADSSPRRALEVQRSSIMDRLPYHIHSYRQPLWLRLPKHPTVAGYFWIAYFVVLGVLVFG